MANMATYVDQARQKKLKEQEEQRIAKESALHEQAEARRSVHSSSATRILLQGLKSRVIKEMTTFIPLSIMNEAFSRIVVNALPHDEEYIEACRESIYTVNKVYLHHLGGLKYLKEQAVKTNSTFLKNFYAMVKENSDAILKDKLEAIRDAESEDEIHAIIKSGITADQSKKINDDIEDLGPDEISELVQNKVLDVVKDESKKQAEDTAFRAELKQRAEDYEKQNNETLNPSITNADADDNGETNTNDEPSEEEPKEESALLLKYLVDPTVLHEATLFYSMVNAVYHDTVKEALNTNVDPNTVPKTPETVLTSPLNMNIFDVYLNDYQDDLKHVDSLRIANKQPLAGSNTRINSEDVLAEALMQYTMLETAMTIKLIEPTKKEVRMVAEYNMRKR